MPPKEEESYDAKRAAMATDGQTSRGGGNIFDGSQDYMAWRTWAQGKALFGRNNKPRAAETVFDCLRGGPAVQVMSGANATGDPFNTVEDILVILDQAYGGTAGMGQQEADRQLIRLRQGKKSFNDFTQEFLALCAQSSFTRTAKIAALQAAVNGQLAPMAAMIPHDSEVGVAITQLRKVDAMAPRSTFQPTERRQGKFTRGRQAQTGERDLSQVECYGCHRKGHLKRDCRSTKGKQAKSAKEATSADDEEDIVEYHPMSGNE